MTKNKIMDECISIFKSIGMLDKNDRYTTDFFELIAPPLVDQLLDGLTETFCDEEGIMVVCDTMYVLLENNFIDSASCLLEHLFKKTGDVPEFLETLLNDKEYAPIFLKAVQEAIDIILEYSDKF